MSPEPTRVRAPGSAGDPSAERDARRREREDRRGPSRVRPEERSRSRRGRPSVSPGVARAGVVGVAVAIAAVMGSQGAQGWLIGLVVSVVMLVLLGAVERRS